MQSISGFSRLPVLIVLLGSMFCAAVSDAMDITASGSWSISIVSGDLIAGAGSNLTDTYESPAGQVQLNIFNTSGSSDNWRIDVRRTDANWPAGLTLLVRRTDDGTGLGSILDGNAYQPVSATDSAFFTGCGDRSSIGLQLLLTGVSVQLDPQLYAESLIYTVVDTL